MVKQLQEVVAVQRIEHIDLCAREQGAYHLKRRILGRRTDECHRAALHGAQQRVLLRLVEAVNLVDEQDGTARGEHAACVGLTAVEHFAHVFHARSHGA